jgi:hypothetical protein
LPDQQELFNLSSLGVRGEPWYVTFALPGFSGNSNRRRWYHEKIMRERTREKYLGSAGAALVFVDKHRHPRELFKNIQTVPAVAGLFRNKYWVAFYGSVAVVDTTPLMPAPYAKETTHVRPTHFGMRNGNQSFFWSAGELGRQCNRIEQFSNCAYCMHASDLGKCTEVNAVRWARKHGLRADAVRLKEVSKDEAARCDKELSSLLRTQCRNSTLKFVSPGVISGPFETKLMYVNELDFSDLEQSIEDMRNRGTDAHSTRRALVRCKEECYLYGPCGMTTKPYYGYPRKCQAGLEDVAGPFSEYEIVEAAKREVASWNPRRREDVALIARYGGSVTRALGREMVLRKMDSKLQNVEFIHEQSKETWVYSFQDACEIMRARYRDGYGYSSKRWYPERTKPMSDGDYLIYAELCQLDDVYTGGWGCYQPTTYVEWHDDHYTRFSVGVRHNHSRSVNTLLCAGEITRGWRGWPRWRGWPSLATPDNIMAVRAEVGPETT